MKKVFKEVSQLVEKSCTKKAIAIVIITMLVSLLMLLSSCNVTRVVTTEASHFQKGDTTTTIVTKTTETTKDQAEKIWLDAPRKTFVAEENGKIYGTYYIKTNQVS